MPSKKRKYNARFPAGRIKRIMRIDDDIGKVALPVPVMISRALELFVSSLLNKAGDITIQKNAKTLTLSHLKQCIYSDSRLDFLKELVKNTPDTSDECNDISFSESPIPNKLITNDESDEETSDCHGSVDDGTTTVERRRRRRQHVGANDDGCLCRRGLHPVTFSRTAPAADTVAYLSAIRTALRRAAADAVSRCPAVRRARSAVLSDAAWSDYLLDVLSSPADEYVGYVAVCVASEAVLYRRTATVGCTSTRDALVDGLVRLSTAAQSPVEVDEMEAGRAAALNVFGRVLDALADDDDDDGSAGTRRDEIKTFLLDRLHDVWPTLVDAATVDGRHRTAVLFELMRLWKSVLAAADRSPWRYYYATLPRLERVLYRTDTDPDVWLNAVRLLGAGLRSRPRDKTGGCRRDDGAAALAERIATRVTRLLYFMGKTVKNVSGRGDTRAAAVVVQETVLLAMRSLRVLARTATATAAATTSDVIDCLDSYMKSRGLVAVDVRFSRWLVRLTCDRDDTLVECLTCALAVAPAVPPLLLDPFDAFVEFLACVSFDADVLLDFLMSDDENDFLPYALHVLKTACCDPPEFFRGCGRRLPDTMELLVRLRLKILRLHENRVFPYNIGPLAKLIERCDRSYCEFLESRRSTR